MPFWFLRHGESLGNAQGCLSGSLDVPLTERGTRQAIKAAEYLAKQTLQGPIFSSPLKRARETAEIIASHTGLPLVIENGLAERFFGDLEGSYLPIDSIWDSIKDGEDIDDFTDRVLRAVSRCQKSMQERTGVIVAHAGVLLTLDKELSLGLRMRDYKRRMPIYCQIFSAMAEDGLPPLIGPV